MLIVDFAILFLRYKIPNGRQWRGIKDHLDEGERWNLKKKKKTGFKFNIKKKKTKIVTSGLITSWQIEVEKEEAVTDCIFLGSKITADDNCRH